MKKQDRNHNCKFYLGDRVVLSKFATASIKYALSRDGLNNSGEVVGMRRSGYKSRRRTNWIVVKFDNGDSSDFNRSFDVLELEIELVPSQALAKSAK